MNGELPGSGEPRDTYPDLTRRPGTEELAVSDFDQAGDVEDLYRYFGIDVPTIVGAAWDLLDQRNGMF